MKKEELKIGQEYWIFDGTMNPVKKKLHHIDNFLDVACFGDTGGIRRKIKSVYMSKEEALQKNQY